MPDPASDPAKLAAAAPAGASPPSESPNPASPPPAHPPPQPAAVGRLLRVLVEGGADAMAAYTAVEEAQSMALESAATQVQPMLAEMRQLFAERDRKLDDLSRNLDTFKQVVDTKLDALKRELRLVWGALGVLITLLIAVFGFVFGT